MAIFNHLPKIDRRGFLRLAGVAVGGIALGGFAPSLTHASASLRVGLILPQSQMAPQFGRGLLHGLRQATTQTPIHFSVNWYAPNPLAALAAVRETLAQQRVDVLVGALSYADTVELHPLLEAAGVPLVISDMGGHMSRPRTRHPLVLRHSLGNWRSAWALGQWAAKHVGPNILIASSFYDSGYDTNYAFWQGMLSAGGETPRLVVTHRPDGGNFADIQAAVRAQRPDGIFASYSGKRAIEFVQFAARSGIKRDVPIFGSPFLTDETLWPQQGRAAQGIVSAHSWQAQPDVPTAFTALGIDTGRILAAAVQHPQPNTVDTLISAAPHDLRWNDQTMEFQRPVFLREVQMREHQLVHRQLEELTVLSDQPLAVPTGPRSGWRNAYLVV